MIEEAFRWLGHTSVGLFMRDSTWGFAVVETVHLLGLAVLGGAALVIDLAAARLLFRRTDPRGVIASAAPALAISLGVMLVSGALLLSSKPVRYFLDDMFRTKMALLALAILASLGVQRLAARAAVPSASLRVLAIVALLLWLGVGVSGRIIGLL
jgi:hypothetical protein